MREQAARFIGARSRRSATPTARSGIARGSRHLPPAHPNQSIWRRIRPSVPRIYVGAEPGPSSTAPQEPPVGGTNARRPEPLPVDVSRNPAIRFTDQGLAHAVAIARGERRSRAACKQGQHKRAIPRSRRFVFIGLLLRLNAFPASHPSASFSVAQVSYRVVSGGTEFPPRTRDRPSKSASWVTGKTALSTVDARPRASP